MQIDANNYERTNNMAKRIKCPICRQFVDEKTYLENGTCLQCGEDISCEQTIVNHFVRLKKDNEKMEAIFGGVDEQSQPKENSADLQEDIKSEPKSRPQTESTPLPVQQEQNKPNLKVNFDWDALMYDDNASEAENIEENITSENIKNTIIKEDNNESDSSKDEDETVSDILAQLAAESDSNENNSSITANFDFQEPSFDDKQIEEPSFDEPAFNNINEEQLEEDKELEQIITQKEIVPSQKPNTHPETTETIVEKAIEENTNDTSSKDKSNTNDTVTNILSKVKKSIPLKKEESIPKEEKDLDVSADTEEKVDLSKMTTEERMAYRHKQRAVKEKFSEQLECPKEVYQSNTEKNGFYYNDTQAAIPPEPDIIKRSTIIKVVGSVALLLLFVVFMIYYV